MKNSIEQLVQSIIEREQKISSLSAFGTSSLSRIIAQQAKASEKFNALNPSISALVAAQMKQKERNSIAHLSLPISKLVLRDIEVADKYSRALSSQAVMANSIVELAKSIQAPRYKGFNALDVALKGLAYSHIVEIAKSREWENLEVIEEANSVISEKTAEFIESDQLIDVDQLKDAIVKELMPLIPKSKGDNSGTGVFIFRVIAIVSLILGTINLYLKLQDRASNEEFKREMRRNFDDLKKQISHQAIQGVSVKDSLETRVSNTRVNLRYSNHKKSKILGVVDKDQIVTVIEIRHKWLLVFYIDNLTSEPKAGFVYKKYFQKIKS